MAHVDLCKVKNKTLTIYALFFKDEQFRESGVLGGKLVKL